MARKKILVVDDDKAVLGVVSSFLDRADAYEILTASSPEEALKIIRSAAQVDLLIADIMMPGMLGPRLFQEIKQLSPKTLCVLISGYTEDMFNIPSDTLFLQKPFDSKQLLSVIDKAIAQ